MATVPLILAEFRSALAAIHTTRAPVNFFREHTTDGPLRRAALSELESFDVETGSLIFGDEFGIGGTAQKTLVVHVLLAHPPFGTERQEEDYVWRDIERIGELLEARSWSTAGIQAVFFNEPAVDESDPSSVFSVLPFRVVYTGAIATS